jgi:hypothetical protein
VVVEVRAVQIRVGEVGAIPPSIEDPRLWPLLLVVGELLLWQLVELVAESMVRMGEVLLRDFMVKRLLVAQREVARLLLEYPS